MQVVQYPKLDSVEKLVNSVKERASYKEDKMISSWERLSTLVHANKQLQCYKDSTSKTNILRSKQRYEKMLALGNLSKLANNQYVQKMNVQRKAPFEKTLMSKAAILKKTGA